MWLRPFSYSVCTILYSKQKLNVVGLFAGIGGFEVGFRRSGHEILILCESDPLASQVLHTHFPDVKHHDDVRLLRNLPSDTDVICAGFPCQDLSMAGEKRGLQGEKSSLVAELFRLLRLRPIPHIVIENVYFMLYLDRGAAIANLINELEDLGYRWAYRIVDSRGFGLAQRRRRVFIVASLEIDPRNVLLSDESVDPDWPKPSLAKPIGFFWTEGKSGHGITADAIPPLKVGSGWGIPTPPAVLLPSGEVKTVPIEVAEQLQGFAKNWTSKLEKLGYGRHRWRLVGNAVSVPIAEWMGKRLIDVQEFKNSSQRRLSHSEKWPKCAWNIEEGRYTSTISEYPIKHRRARLSSFATRDWPNLSNRALKGFISRATQSSLNYPCGFLEALNRELKNRNRATD